MSRGFLYCKQLWKVVFSSTFRTKRGEFARASRADVEEPRMAPRIVFGGNATAGRGSSYRRFWLGSWNAWYSLVARDLECSSQDLRKRASLPSQTNINSTWNLATTQASPVSTYKLHGPEPGYVGGCTASLPRSRFCPVTQRWGGALRDETKTAAWETSAPSAQAKCSRFWKKILLSISFV